MTTAEQVIRLKADEVLILKMYDALNLIRYIAEYETMNVRVHVNYERNKMKLVRIP